MDAAPINPYSRLEVDLDAIAANLAALRALMPAGSRVAAVVKADAYGHGLVPVSQRLKQAGVEALAVAVWPEGLALRQAGVEGPILLLMGHEPEEADRVIELELTPILSRLDCFQALDAAARARGAVAACQLKVDTGMARLGIDMWDLTQFTEALGRLPGIKLTGLVSHLATAGEPESVYAADQTARYSELLAWMREQGWDLPDSSLCGSGGVMDPPAHAPGPPALVRLGITLYGALPHPALADVAKLQTAMRLTSQLIAVRRVPAGQAVSYGCTWQAPAETWLGVVPVGYADGYLRSASNRASMLVDGALVPVRGRVCMNLTMVELAEPGPLPQPGQEVVLLGRQGDQEISLDQLAAWSGTIPYEVSCSLGRANPRHYRPA